MLAVRLGHKREPLSGSEGVVLQCIQPVRDAGDLDDPDTRVLMTDELLGRRVAEPEPFAGALEPDTQALASPPLGHSRA